MSDYLVTVASYWNTVEANLAKNELEAAGLLVFLGDEETVGMAWHLTNAVGGYKLKVREPDVEQARGILAELPPAATAGTAEPPPAEGALARLSAAAEADEDEPLPTKREENAERAFRGAVLGLLLLPLQLYVFWLLLKVYVSDERLRPVPCRRALLAAAINLPMIALFGLILRVYLAL